MAQELTEIDWKQIKDKLQGGISKLQIYKETGRAVSTVDRIAKSNSFDDYKDVVKADNQKYKNVASSMARPKLTEEKFKEIKDMVYRGHTMDEIIKKLSTSYQTIRKINKVNTFEEYQSVPFKKKQNNSISPIHHVQQNPYSRLNLLTKDVAIAIADIVVMESAKHKSMHESKLELELRKENDELKRQNRDLLKEIEDLQEPDIAKLIDERRVQDDRMGEEK